MNKSIDYYTGYKLIIKNAINLQKVAKSAFGEKCYGTACSLNILSAEEAVKGIYVLIKHFSPEIQIDNYHEIFRKHDVKHESLKKIIVIYDNHMKRMEENIILIDMLEQIANKQKNEKAIENLSSLIDLKHNIIKYKNSKNNLEEILDWLENANSDKNNGFYVDQKNSNWITPEEFTEEKYLKENKYTEDIISLVIEFEKVLFTVMNSKLV